MGGRVSRAQVSSSADLVLEVREARLADTRDVLQVLDSRETTVCLAIGDDALGKRGPHARELLEFFGACRVDVDFRLFLRR